MHIPNWLAARRWQTRGAATAALVFSLFTAAQAQESPTTIRLMPEDAERGPGGQQHNFDFLAPGETGDRYRTAGFFGQKLRPYLSSSPEAVEYLDQYKRQKTLFLIDRVVAVGSFGLWGQQILAGDERHYFNDVQKVALGVFATSLLATVFINRNTNTYMLRAVKAYNDGPGQSRVWPRLRPSSVGIGAASTGQPLLTVRWAVR